MDQRLFHYTSFLNEPDADCLILLGPDDCDFNLHLSNSCYAKVSPGRSVTSVASHGHILQSLDCARLQHALKCFPTLFRTGGWMALGGELLVTLHAVLFSLNCSFSLFSLGTHYNFLREIPILSRYEVRVSIAAWDNKWVRITWSQYF